MSESAGNGTPARLENEARADTVRVLYRHAFPALLIALVSATILMVALWPSVDRAAALGWFAAVVATSLVRLGLFVRYRRAQPRGVDALAWERPFLLTLLLSSLVWGLGLVLILPADSLAMQLFGVVFLMGMAGGTLSAYSSISAVATTSILALLVPVVVWLFTRGTTLHALLGLAILVALAAFVRAIRGISDTLFRSVLGGHETRAANALAEQRAEELRRGNQRLVESERRFRHIAENSADTIWVLDLKAWRATYVSPAVERLLGYSPDEVDSLTVESLLTPESLGLFMRHLAQARELLRSGGDTASLPATLEFDLVRKDGSVVSVEATAALQPDPEAGRETALVVTRDVSERKRATESLQRMAFFDSLTDLPNRRLLIDRLQQSLAKARRERSCVTLLFVDLDRFKEVNDEHGHLSGDRVLEVVSERLRASVRESDTAARIGGDEFVVLLPGAAADEAGARVAELIRKSLEQPVEGTDGKPISISCSVGIAAYPDDAGNEWDLLRLGDELMYAAKQDGGNRVVYADRDKAPPAPVWKATPAEVRLVWSDSCASGDATIDAQHAELFEKANRLIEVLSDGRHQTGELLRPFDELLQHVARHFADEELVLRRSGYRHLESHARIHRRLLERASDLRQRAGHGDVSLVELIDFLAMEVVSRHIVRDDARFFAHLAGASRRGEGAAAG